MDIMSGFELYFNIIMLACGIYCLYTALKLRKWGKLFPSQLLIPKGSKPEDCIDEGAYVTYIGPRLLFVGILLTLVGAICLADSYFQLSATLFPQIKNLSFYIMEGSTILALVLWIWYMVCWVKGRKMFWE